jgi:palmitoyltransferase ZDHHC9/14/18
MALQRPEGANKVFCGGKIVTGPNPLFLVLTFLLIFMPVLFFLQKDAPLISQKPFGKFAVLLVVIFACLTLLTLVLAALTEPGIIPRKATREHVGEDFHTEFIVEVVNGESLRRKWCETCQFYRPPRARHCRDCDNCVERWDHHCPWIDNCVGLRNARYFVAFISATTALAVAILFSILWVVYLDDAPGTVEGYFAAMFTEPHRYFVIVVAMVAALLLSNLTAYHLHLISRNLTTAEHVKDDYPSGKSPFSIGMKYNCLSFWLTPTPRSELDGGIDGTELTNQLGSSAFKE